MKIRNHQRAGGESTKRIPKGMGWPTGLEPATARTTIWGSTIELRPPIANTLDFRMPYVKFMREKSQGVADSYIALCRLVTGRNPF